MVCVDWHLSNALLYCFYVIEICSSENLQKKERKEPYSEHFHGQIHSNDRGSAAHAGEVEGADAALELEVVHHRSRQRRRRVERCAVHDQAVYLHKRTPHTPLDHPDITK